MLASLILTLSGIAGSSHLLLSHAITEKSFVPLVLASVLVGLLIFYGDRVSSLSFKNGSIDLAKIEEARMDVEAKRDEVEKLAYLTVRLVVAAKASALEWDGNDDADEQFENTAREILEKIGVPASDPLFSEIASAGGHKVTEA